MASAPVLCGWLSADRDPDADDADEDQDHADQDDEMGGVLAQREARNGPFFDVRDEAVLYEIEQQAEGHHGHAETGQTRKRRPSRERRDGERIDQWRTSWSVSIANADYC
jgi:hypothetical protein